MTSITTLSQRATDDVFDLMVDSGLCGLAALETSEASRFWLLMTRELDSVEGWRIRLLLNGWPVEEIDRLEAGTRDPRLRTT